MISRQSVIDVLKERQNFYAERNMCKQMFAIAGAIGDVLALPSETPWHTGTPTEEGWYLVTSGGNNSASYDIGKWDGESFCYMEYLDSANVVAWQKITPYEEKENG